MSVRYKLADLSDLKAMVKVGCNLFDNPIKEDRAREFFDDQRHHLFLAYDGEVVIGMASAFHYVHPDKHPNLFINEVSVLKSHRSNGIARTLVKQLVTYAKKELDCNEAWIATMDSNLPAQKAFLEAGGKREEEAVVLIEYS